MRAQSHVLLGKYIVRHYMEHTGAVQRKLFLLGCIQPDRNPLTYLKGSFRFRLLHGHHYRSAERFMHRISCRLEARDKLNSVDCYTFGKLIHYIADAFTYVHNDAFSGSIVHHRNYEKQLQTHFFAYLHCDPMPVGFPCATIMETVRKYHREYTAQSQSVLTDSLFVLHASCSVASLLFPQFPECKELL